MFCSGCGKEIPEGSKFCPGCGKATDGTPNVSNTTASSDPTKILKKGEFRRIEKTMDGMSKKNDGTLTLFCNRIEWRGIVNDDIKSDAIAEVAVAYVIGNGGEKLLKITDNAGKIYKYYRVSKVMQRLNTVHTMTGEIGASGAISTLDSINAELEGWREAINKVAGLL
jgi:hypothetical protein